MPFNPAGENAENEMTIGGLGVKRILLFAGQIPVRVKPVRIARGQGEFLGAVSLGQLGLHRLKMRRGRRGTQ